ncbi:diacylglycerol kinase [Rhodococcus ruber]|uniref:diacylglycerol/lipid kinase family protein n=1 Tax=Rhodococcus ruber TaxID=1830 RepID=UPI0019342FA9|nr:diacylglycerol kinase family protein [Rhodococcus ruber]QRE79319.1 diacylglycerol kinase [Rhodococcus ruber]
MSPVDAVPGDHVPTSRRWWARAAFAAVLGAAAVPVIVAGLRGALALLAVSVAVAAVTVAALYWFLATRGLLRALSLGLAVVVPLALPVLFVRERVLWVALVSVALVLLALACARAALRRDTGMPEYPAPPVHRPFLVMNPRSGGGKVVKFDLQRKAEELGAEVALLAGPGPVDVEALARQAVERGADLLGVAGGDGTQALVAAIAAEHGLPFLVISAGTRNHFALDLGLDREDPAAGLDALRDGVELRVDLGRIGGRVFVNNASFGVYADVVQSPEYRDDKAGTALRMMPDLLARDSATRLRARIDGDTTVEGAQAVLVSNDPYATDDLAGLGRRPRLDRGVLGVVTISVAGAGQAVDLLRRTHSRGLVQRVATEVVVDAEAPEIPVGVDGEALTLPTPVRCTVEPQALRVRVPRRRPGTLVSAPTWDWARLRDLAFRPQRSSSVSSGLR